MRIVVWLLLLNHIWGVSCSFFCLPQNFHIMVKTPTKKLCRHARYATIDAFQTVKDAAAAYGYPPNRDGFIRCPFHGGGNERTPSCHLKERFFKCFACQAGGSVIDFTARLFSLSPMDAVKRLNTDFGLGLSLDRHAPTPEELAAARKRREVRDTFEAFQQWRKASLDLLARAIGVGNDALIHGDTMDAWTEAECLAVREQARLEFFYEELEAGDNEAQFACLREWEEVSRIATRICGT